MTTVVITMAGFGRRFLDAGYTVSKYRIVAHGRSLFAWSILSLQSFIQAGARFVFVVRGADAATHFIDTEAALLGIRNHAIVELDSPTDGQATTALLALPVVAAIAAPMLVYNIDTLVSPTALSASSVRGDGWIPCFGAEGDHWSFAEADQQGRVSQLREKVRISPHATIGLYWFSSFELYAEAYRGYYGNGRLEAGERYVAPLYNYMIDHGREVFIQEVPSAAVIPLGLPHDVEVFQNYTPAEIQSIIGQGHK